MRGAMIDWKDGGWTINLLTNEEEKASRMLMDVMDACEEVLSALKDRGDYQLQDGMTALFTKEGGLLCTSVPSAQERQ